MKGVFLRCAVFQEIKGEQKFFSKNQFVISVAIPEAGMKNKEKWTISIEKVRR